MLIILDLDHTLLNSDGEITNKTMLVLKKCQENGHKIIINSARSYIRTKKISAILNANYTNCFHGNLVLDNENNVIFSNDFKFDNKMDLIKEFLNVYNGWVGIETKDNAYCTDENMAKKIGAQKATLEEMQNLTMFKMIFQIDSSKRKYYEEIIKKYPCEIIFNREGYFCTLMPKGSNKWNGLKMIKNRYPNEKTIAFGDEITDLKTFENVDIPVAMANSTEDIKKKFKILTKSNDEDGVAYYLEKMLNSNLSKL